MSTYRPADIVSFVEGYDHLEQPVAVIAATSWSHKTLTPDHARMVILRSGYVPTGEPEWDRWFSVVKGDDQCGSFDWHSEGSGRRWVSVHVFCTTEAVKA